MEENILNSEEEVGKRILHLHDVLGLGYRRIAKKLGDEGVRLNKDQVNKLYLKYTDGDVDEVEGDKVLERLREAEAKARNELEVKREKQEIRRRLVELSVEKRTLTFDQRRELFTNQDKLLRFAKRVMRVLDPMLWTDFCEFCEERDYDLADAVAESLGDQFKYENQDENSSKGKHNFGLYLVKAIEIYLDVMIRQEEHAEEEKKRLEEAALWGKKRWEIITIQAPDFYYK